MADPDGPNNGFLWRSTYIEIIKEWLKYFPKEQLLILDSDELIRNPVQSMKRTEKFLGIRPYLDSSMFVRNKKTGFFCIREEKGKERLHCLGKSKGRPHPNIDPLVKQKLHDYFYRYNDELFKLVGRRFKWEGM